MKWYYLFIINCIRLFIHNMKQTLSKINNIIMYRELYIKSGYIGFEKIYIH